MRARLSRFFGFFLSLTALTACASSADDASEVAAREAVDNVAAAIETPGGGGSKSGPIAPAPVLTGVRSNHGGRTILLNAACAGNAEQHVAERRLSGSSTWTSLGVMNVSCAVLGDATIEPDTTYCYRVTAQNSTNLARSNELCVRTDRYREPPHAPVYARSAASQSRIVLSLKDASDIEDGYRLLRKTASGWREVATTGPQRGTFDLVDTGVEPDHAYSYQVVAYHRWGSASTDTIVVSSMPTVPEAPTNLVATATAPDSIRLAWTDNSSNEDGFRVLYQYAGEERERQVGRSETSVAVGPLRPSTEYCFRVVAFNEAGTSSAERRCFTTDGSSRSPADLIVSDLVPTPPLPSRGQSVTLAFTVCNAGGTAAGAFEWKVLFDRGDVARGSMPGLAAGACASIGPTRLTSSIPLGSHTGTVVVDSGNDVTESSEANNVSENVFLVND